VLLVVALLVGTTLGLLILNTAIAVDSLKATRLQAENAELAQEVQRLEQRVVSGSAPAQIAEAAADAGLVPAATAGYLVIGPDGTVVLRGSPEPAPEPEPEPGTKPEAGTEPDTEPGTEPDTEPGTEPDTEPETEPDSETETQTETEPDAEAGSSTSTGDGG
jgi:type II secretory pathway pseudopilin PulG